MNHTLRQHEALARHARATVPPPEPRAERPADIAARLRVVDSLLSMRGVRASIMMIQTRPLPMVILYHCPSLDRLDAERIGLGYDRGGHYEWREIILDGIPVRWRKPVGR